MTKPDILNRPYDAAFAREQAIASATIEGFDPSEDDADFLAWRSGAISGETFRARETAKALAAADK